MKFAAVLVSLLLFRLADAQEIEPTGTFIAVDKEYDRVLQVHANGVALAYKLVGSGEPLVMVMGLGGRMDDWTKDFVGELSKRFQLIIFDNRGMGYSTVDNTKFSYRLWADDLVGLLDALGIERANVFGYSMGSAITQELMLDYPHRIHKAVLCGPSVYGSNMLNAVAGVNFNDPIVQRQIEAAKDWVTPLGDLPSVTDQVMVLVASSDAEVDVENSKAMATAIPGAWLIQFKSSQPPLVSENAEFARVMATFFATGEGTPK